MTESGAFHRDAWPTLGVEIELQLVDAETMALRSAFEEVLGGVHAGLRESIKPEFMQCYVEITTDVARSVTELGDDLARKVRCVEEAAAAQGARLFWAGTHPFSRWQDQRITPNPRYYHLAELLQETVCRPVTFGLHVHVGVDSGDKAVAVCNRLQTYLPLLLALSANSPFWQGRRTGHHAHRIEVLEGFPTGGLPPRFGSWDDYLRLVEQLQTARCIESPHDLWWDVRPSPDNGTIEVRICDMPRDLPGVLGLAALTQCLVRALGDEVHRGVPEPECHPLLLRQNRWRACRYGLGAELVDPVTLAAVPARRLVENLVERLRDTAADLGCSHHLESVVETSRQPNGAERQLALYRETGDLARVVRRLAEASSLSVAYHPGDFCGGQRVHVGAFHAPYARL